VDEQNLNKTRHEETQKATRHKKNSTASKITQARKKLRTNEFQTISYHRKSNGWNGQPKEE
jgi:hypothetical protein